MTPIQYFNSLPPGIPSLENVKNGLNEKESLFNLVENYFLSETETLHEADGLFYAGYERKAPISAVRLDNKLWLRDELSIVTLTEYPCDFVTLHPRAMIDDHNHFYAGARVIEGHCAPYDIKIPIVAGNLLFYSDELTNALVKQFFGLYNQPKNVFA